MKSAKSTQRDAVSVTAYPPAAVHTWTGPSKAPPPPVCLGSNSATAGRRTASRRLSRSHLRPVPAGLEEAAASLIKHTALRARAYTGGGAAFGRINGGVNVPAFAVGRMGRGRTDGHATVGETPNYN